MTHDGKATGMTLTEEEREALACAIHDALRCNCDSGEADRMNAGEIAPAVEAILAARVTAVSAELTQACTQLAAIEALRDTFDTADALDKVFMGHVVYLIDEALKPKEDA